MSFGKIYYEPDPKRDPLRLDRCPDCGYSFEGLREQGLCPECGSACDAEMVVLSGPVRAAGPDRRQSVAAERKRVLLISSLVAAAFALNALASMYPVLLRIPWVFLVILGFVPVKVYRNWRHAREETPGAMQLRLTPEGFAVREFIGRVKLQPWRPYLRVNVQVMRWPPFDFPWRRWPAELHWVTIRIVNSEGVMGPTLLVDFGFGCKPAAAEEIRRRVQRWIGARAAGAISSQ